MKLTITTFFISVVGILTPIIPLVTIAFLAIILDTYFGLWRSVKKGGWKSIKSRRLSDTISKTLLYVGGITALYLAEIYILTGLSLKYTQIDLILTKAFTLFCLFTEAKSINESYYSVTNKDLWSSFITFVKRAKEQKDNL
jgi:hypothetical protein